MAEQEFERIYNIPLRKGCAVAPQYRRAAKAARVLRKFLERHSKSTNVKIGKYLNQKILEKGKSNIPHHVLVKVIKNKDGLVNAELVGAPVEKSLEKKETKTKETAKPVPEKLDVEAIKKEKEELEKKKVLEHSSEHKEKHAKDKKDITSEVDEEIRKKGMVKRSDKKEMISK